MALFAVKREKYPRSACRKRQEKIEVQMKEGTAEKHGLRVITCQLLFNLLHIQPELFHILTVKLLARGRD